MGRAGIVKDSVEYAEIVAEVFVETVQRAEGEVMCCEHEHEEITRSLMACLQYVYLHSQSSIHSIADGLEITMSAASQLVEKLVKRQLVTRRESEGDRRVSEIQLTPAGRGIVKQMCARKSEWFASTLNAMPEDKRRAFIEGLEEFLWIALAAGDRVDRACTRCGQQHVSFCVVNKVRTAREES